jgi:hypothetical protein
MTGPRRSVDIVGRVLNGSLDIALLPTIPMENTFKVHQGPRTSGWLPRTRPEPKRSEVNARLLENGAGPNPVGEYALEGKNEIS